MEAAPTVASKIEQLRVLGGFDHVIPDEVLETALRAGGMDLQRAEDICWCLVSELETSVTRRSTVPISPQRLIPQHHPAPAPVLESARFPSMPRKATASTCCLGDAAHKPPVHVLPASKGEIIDLSETPPRTPGAPMRDVDVTRASCHPADEANDDDDVICAGPANSGDSVPLLTIGSPSGEWPKQLRPFLVQTSCAVKGIYPHLHTTQLTFWTESCTAYAANATKAQLSGQKRPSTGKWAVGADKSAWDLGAGDVRFGFASCSASAGPAAIGKLPRSYGAFLAPLLDRQLISVSGSIMKLMRYTGGRAGPADGETDRVLSSTPAHSVLRGALFELLYYSCKSAFAPKPQSNKTKATAASTPAAAPASSKLAVDQTSPRLPDLDGGVDNAEETVAADQVQQLLHEKEETAPRLPVAPQPSLLCSIKLRPYQRQAIAWMVARENEDIPTGDDPNTVASAFGVALDALSYAPAERSTAVSSLFSEAVNSASAPNSMMTDISMWERQVLPDASVIFLNPYTRVVSLSPPPIAKACLGGILADEMGLGKTVEFCCLLLAQTEKSPPAALKIPSHVDSTHIRPSKRTKTPETAEEQCHEPTNDMDEVTVIIDEESRLPKVSATLVVCPMSMMGQWKRELDRYTCAAPGTSRKGAAGLRTVLHYGNSRLKSCREIVDYDVIITSFGTLASEYDALNEFLDSPSSGAASGGHVLFDVAWERVALDEAHTIRNRTTKVARACFDVTAKYRWALTGTPIQNSLQDLYSLLRFLKHEPWSELLWWKRVISEPFERREPRAIDALQSVLAPLLLRRTKKMRDLDGTVIGDLAPADIRVIPVHLAPDERSFYDQLYNRSKIRFQDFVAAGSVLSHYAQIFTLLLRLRQACLHPFLVIAAMPVARMGAQAESTDDLDGAPIDNSMFSPEFLNQLFNSFMAKKLSCASSGATQPAMPHAALSTAAVQPSPLDERLGLVDGFVMTQLEQLRSKGVTDEECPVCFERLVRSRSCILSCAHLLCRGCALAQVKKLAVCPICRHPISKADVVSLSEQPDAPLNQPSFNFAKISRQSIKTGDDVPWRSSTKLDMLCDDVIGIRDHNRTANAQSFQVSSAELSSDEPGEYCQTIGGMYIQGAVRVVVFSSFTFMLDLIERAFTNVRIKFARFDGSMTQPQREAALRTFRTDSDTFVILMSLKAGGLGLNLTEASIVYLMDPWWNPSQEHQALSRVHRLGQKKQVYAKRFIAVDTIEESMLEIQERKQRLAHDALSSSGSGAHQKLTEEEIRGFFRR